MLCFNRFAVVAFAQILVTLPLLSQDIYEPFDYEPGSAVAGQGNWMIQGSGTSPVVEEGNLSAIGVPEPLGNRITWNNPSVSLRWPWGNEVTEGSLYFSFLHRVDALGTFGNVGTLAGFASGTGTFFVTKVNIRTTGTGTYQLGTSKGGGVTWGDWASTEFEPGETVFVVGRYTFNTEESTDDVCDLWLNPDPKTFGAEQPPIPTVTGGPGGNDATMVDRFFFRSGGAASSPVKQVADELRIGTTWASVTPPGVIPPPPLAIADISLTEDQHIELILETQMPGREHQVEQTSALSEPEWLNVPGVVISSLSENVLKARFPAPEGAHHFYRGVSLPIPPIFFDDLESGASGWTHGGSGDSWELGTPQTLASFTERALLQDFVFSRDSAGDGGLDVLIQGLEPNAPYIITIWSFDTGSSGDRVSEWSANGSFVQTYTFDGMIAPGSNEQYRFSFEASASGSGEVLIAGRRNLSNTSFAVFLNALQVHPADDPASAVLSLDVNRRAENTEANTHPGFDTFVIDSEGSATAVQTNPTVRTYGPLTVTLSPVGVLEYDDRNRNAPQNSGIDHAHSGVNAWATGLNQPYATETDQWLRSPAIDLTQAAFARLEFWEVRDVEPLFAGTEVDYTSVRIKDAADPDAEPIVELSRDVGTQTQWTKRSFVLGEEVLGKTILLEFLLYSDDFQPEPQNGWWIDDVGIYAE